MMSGLECNDEIYSSVQLAAAAPGSEVAVKLEAEQRSPSEGKREVPPQTGEQAARKLFAQPKPVAKPADEDGAEAEIEARPAPTSVTAKLFKPLAVETKQPALGVEDMNKGFLSYSDDENTLTIMKDEPEDLTHLAPTAGDTCVPLAPFSEMLMDHFMLGDEPFGAGPLLSDSARGISPASSPYLSYRDEGSLSPGLTHSPSSLPSLLGEESPARLDETASMSQLLGLDVDSLDADDLSVKAPYISMSDADDFPLLVSGDLMWSSCGVPSPSPSHAANGWSSPPPLVEKPPTSDMDSSLAKLLRTDSPGSLRNFSQHSTTNNSHSTFSSQRKGEIDRRKRPVSELSGSGKTNCKRSKQSPSVSTIPRPGVLDGGGSSIGRGVGGVPRQSNSVLMNLLVSGCDVSAGYICLNARKPYARSYTPWS